jgi:hypothetical protein
MVKKKKVEVGSIFVVPLGSDILGIGQLMHLDPGPYVCIFEKTIRSDEEVSGDLGSPLLAGFVTDRPLERGRWRCVGVRDLVCDVPFPPYVVDTPNGTVLKDFYGAEIRNAREGELEAVGRRFLSSPQVFENGLRHFLFGGDPSWGHEKIHVPVLLKKVESLKQ